MKKRLWLMILFAALCLSAICGCASSGAAAGGYKVTFELEGGNFSNSTLPVVHNYHFSDGKEHTIKELTYFSGGEFLRAGYQFDGWYKTKSGEGETATYSDKWDFDNDTITSEGVTLYAKWVRKLKFTYSVYALVGDEEEFVKTVNGYEGFEFSQRDARRAGYTALDFFDENGEKWDFGYKNYSGDVKVVVKYIEGDYALVSTFSELKAAAAKNVYLLGDIDCEGGNLNFEDYSYKEFKGNGYTVKNFAVDYKASKDNLRDDPLGEGTKDSLLISIFGNIDNAVIENVSFTGVTINVNVRYTGVKKIYVSPIAISAKESEIKGVSFTGTILVNELPSGFDRDSSLTIVEDKEYLVGENTSAEDNDVNLIVAE